VGPPQVITKDVGGKKHEPFEEALVEVPSEHMGQVRRLGGFKGVQESGRGPREQMGLGFLAFDRLVGQRECA